jgi:hypothetical protein
MAEKEYIERGSLLKQMEDRLKQLQLELGDHDQYTLGFDEGCIAVDFEPAADVVEVKHGEWIESFSNGVWHYDCPFCDDGYATSGRDTTPPNYCSNCGARLGERKEQKQTDCLTCRYFVECEPDMIAYHNDPCDLYKERKDETNG